MNHFPTEYLLEPGASRTGTIWFHHSRLYVLRGLNSSKHHSSLETLTHAEILELLQF